MRSSLIEVVTQEFSKVSRGVTANLALLTQSVEPLRKDTKAKAQQAEIYEAIEREISSLSQLEQSEQSVALARILRWCHTLPKIKKPLNPAKKSLVPVQHHPLLASVSVLKGVGPVVAQKLAARELTRIVDLLWWLPIRYLDLRTPLAIGELNTAADTCAFWGQVDRVRWQGYGARRFLEAKLREPKTNAVITVRWFHAHAGLANQLPPGEIVVLVGQIGNRGHGLESANPKVFGEGEQAIENVRGVWPVYAAVPGIPPATLRKICAQAVADGSNHLDSAIPLGLADSLGLPNLSESISTLHQPPVNLDQNLLEALSLGTTAWHRRLALEEIFVLCARVAWQSRDRLRQTAPVCQEKPRHFPEFEFVLTDAQKKVIAEIANDMQSSQPMSRLLQGDVGAGKTAVAYAACRQASNSGLQAAWMAPTEILAEQHAASLERFSRASGLKVALLTAALPKAARESLVRLVAAGQYDVVVGTHALLASDVEFKDLGLVIIDEQHRFGVMQRMNLRRKSDALTPHLLVMTATPIPRTLALTVYGDLEVSLLDQLPPGRKPVATQWLHGELGIATATQTIKNAVANGDQVFMVVPLIEANPELLKDAWDINRVETWVREHVSSAKSAVLHGRLNYQQRMQALTEFRDGKIDVLCATTVIEVGVDIPNANLMVIFDAGRFGLAQLHQLRGRVGRGNRSAKCLLLTSGEIGELAEARLTSLELKQDGFALAEDDLAQRGPGELWGLKQSGLPALRFANLARDIDLVAAARAWVKQINATDPELVEPQHSQIHRAMELYGHRTMIAEQAG